MNFASCPGCRNQIASDAIVCPVCGCKPAHRRLTRILKWSIALLILGWAVEHVVTQRLGAHPAAAHHASQHRHA